MGQTMRLDEQNDLLVTATSAEHMDCTGPESSANQARHDLNTSNTTFGLEEAGRPPARIARLFRYQPLLIPPLRQNQPRSIKHQSGDWPLKGDQRSGDVSRLLYRARTFVPRRADATTIVGRAAPRTTDALI